MLEPGRTDTFSSYLGLVYEEPHEGGHQHGAGHAAFSPHLLLEEGEGGGRRLLGYGHRVGLSHARHAGGLTAAAATGGNNSASRSVLREASQFLSVRDRLSAGRSFIHSFI